MRLTGDTTPDKIIEIMDEKPVKKGCDGNCDCLECDDISGDNVEWLNYSIHRIEYKEGFL
jgi:hypothetical protein